MDLPANTARPFTGTSLTYNFQSGTVTTYRIKEIEKRRQINGKVKSKKGKGNRNFFFK